MGLGAALDLGLQRSFGSLVQDPDPNVRAEVARSLGAVGNRAALVQLQRMAHQDPVLRNRNMAREAIAGIEARCCSIEDKRRQVAVNLARVLADKHQLLELRRRAGECLRHLRHPYVVPILCQVAEDCNDTDVHEEIVHILVSFPPSKALQEGLLKFIRHVSRRVRRPAIVALGRVGDRDMIFFLSDIVRIGRQPDQLFDAEDVLLAEQAIRDIDLRTGRRPFPSS